MRDEHRPQRDCHHADGGRQWEQPAPDALNVLVFAFDVLSLTRVMDHHDISGGAQSGLKPGRGPFDLVFIVHGVSLSCLASAARPRAAVDLTVPGLIPSVPAISASDISR